MADFWELRAIAERMGWKDPSSPVRTHLHESFPMFPRHIAQESDGRNEV